MKAGERPAYRRRDAGMCAIRVERDDDVGGVHAKEGR
jgi:hypothetical protein